MLAEVDKNCIRDKNTNIITSLFAWCYETPWLGLSLTLQTTQVLKNQTERKQPRFQK